MIHDILLIGMTVGCALVIYLSFKAQGKSGPAKYDERQALARGKAYRLGFYVLSVYMLANALYYLMTESQWADPVVNAFLGFYLGTMAFVVSCIRNDAYFALNQHPRSSTLLFAVLAAMNLLSGLMNLWDGESIFTDGMLNYLALNFMMALMFVVLLIALAVKRAMSRQNREADE